MTEKQPSKILLTTKLFVFNILQSGRPTLVYRLLPALLGADNVHHAREVLSESRAHPRCLQHVTWGTSIKLFYRDSLVDLRRATFDLFKQALHSYRGRSDWAGTATTYSPSGRRRDSNVRSRESEGTVAAVAGSGGDNRGGRGSELSGNSRRLDRASQRRRMIQPQATPFGGGATTNSSDLSLSKSPRTPEYLAAAQNEREAWEGSHSVVRSSAEAPARRLAAAQDEGEAWEGSHSVVRSSAEAPARRLAAAQDEREAWEGSHSVVRSSAEAPARRLAQTGGKLTAKNKLKATAKAKAKAAAQQISIKATTGIRVDTASKGDLNARVSRPLRKGKPKPAHIVHSHSRARMAAAGSARGAAINSLGIQATEGVKHDSSPAAAVGGGRPKVVIVTRNATQPLTSPGRKLSLRSEEQLLQAFQQRGFTAAICCDYKVVNSVDAFLDYFLDVDICVGVHGAGLANCALGSHGMVVVELQTHHAFGFDSYLKVIHSFPSFQEAYAVALFMRCFCGMLS